jgi:phospholipid/cholesterol/gamma-HCH transport system substrate-binding protein
MEDTRKVNLKVGITVIVAVLILLYGLAFLKEFNLNLNEYEVSAYFHDVIGLKEGDPVAVSGYTKGKVKRIDNEGDSVKVTFSLAKDIVIKKDYRIQVTMLELMSGKQISVFPGRSNELADVSKPLSGEKGWDVVALIQSMGEVTLTSRSVVSRLDSVMAELNKTTRSVTSLVNDETFRSNIHTSASNFNAASKNLNSLIEENRNSLRGITGKLHSVADNLDQTISQTRPELHETIRDIRDLTSKMDTLTMNFNQIALNAQDSTNTVGKLLTGDEFYKNLNKTVNSINRLVQKINKDGIRLRLF